MKDKIVNGKPGIVLVCCGHAYYGRYCYNLAVSIKAVEPDMPIAVLYNGAALNHIGQHQMDVFDTIIEIPADVPANTTAKLHAYKYTPFDNTLLLDVDTVWLPHKKPSDLFKEMGCNIFSAITEGKASEPAKNYFFWAPVEEMRRQYNIEGEIYQWRTEVMYFTIGGRKILEKALQIVENPGMSGIMQFGGSAPDELGINVACAVYDVHPHEYKWKASFWHMMNGNNIPPQRELYEKYYLMSFGSNNASGTIKKYYDMLMNPACQKLGVNHVFPLHSKRDFLPSRLKM